ncbi:MAG: chemotaxis protein CheW [Cyanobacteria bacterium P01_A01_bin.135]
MTPNSSTLAPAPPKQYILSRVGSQCVAFDERAVSSILLIERSQVLALPFYDDVISGIVHHQGQIITLVALGHLLENMPGQIREVFNAVQLGESTGLAGLALIVDQLMGQCGADQMAANQATEFQPQDLGPALWQPRR